MARPVFVFELYHGLDRDGQRARRFGARRWQAIDGFRSEQRSCAPRKPRSEPQTSPAPFAERPLRRWTGPPCGVQPTETGNGRPEAEKAALKLRDLEGKTAPRQLPRERPLTGQEAPRAGVSFGRGRQRSGGLTPSHHRGARRDLLAGCQRSRREAPNEETQTFESPRPSLPGFRAPPSPRAITTENFRTYNVMSLSERPHAEHRRFSKSRSSKGHYGLKTPQPSA